MKELFVLIAHLLTTLITLARPGGVRAVAAESMALKLQLVARTRKRAPPMTRDKALTVSAVFVLSS